MKTTLVDVDSIKNPIKRSPGFAKKELATYKLDLMAWCQGGCLYCSSPSGNYLRSHRERFADAAEAQTGRRLYPGKDPELSLRWADFEAQLEAQLRRMPRDGTFGRGEDCQFSQLTDAFSPWAVTSGFTRRTLERCLERTSFRFRILTKYDYVGRKEWIDFFKAHPERFTVGLSIGTLNDTWARRVEIGTSLPSARMRAHHRLQDAGVSTFGMLCPVFPDVLDGDSIEGLVRAIRPEGCERVWSEPYNDRANWRAVATGYDHGTPAHDRMTSLFFGLDRVIRWTDYAEELYERVHAALGVKAHEHRYLLYQDTMTTHGRERMRGRQGVLFQSDESKKRLPTV
jgi:DNA repair photolyase